MNQCPSEPSPWSQRIVTTTLALLVLHTPHPAQGFTRARVSESGAYLFWCQQSPIEVVADESGCPGLTPSSATRALELAVAAWTDVTCGQNSAPPLVSYAGTVQSVSAGYTGTGPQSNSVTWVQDAVSWGRSPAVLAMTTVTFRLATGQILDADIEVNAAHHVFSVADPPARDEVDLQGTLTHELGHLLGLGHSSEPQATMYPSARSGPASAGLRRLHEDDRRGYCALGLDDDASCLEPPAAPPEGQDGGRPAGGDTGSSLTGPTGSSRGDQQSGCAMIQLGGSRLDGGPAVTLLVLLLLRLRSGAGLTPQKREQSAP